MANASILEGTPAYLSPSLLPPVVYGCFGSTATQVVAGVNVATPITYNTTFMSNLCKYDTANPSRIVVSLAGVYKFSYSIQLDKTGGGTSICDMWIARNGNQEALSGSRAVVAGPNGETFPYCEYIIDLNAGGYLEVFFSSPDATMAATYFPATAPAPAVPSIITNIIKIA